ncbi:MAG: tetratricopeptide repeat protein [Drouetiella hepatica Uher 2000/2452]|uniref:Tetratricopeptide repeat protein n=1 Tax=Drouetiella hepatica Uher 2000/2452 TaxID=904376 RepID=A0A951UNY1_9CYAN|nr:tetratricopeptide repeat protein [Drouetiella hepatica Uher 2000/2452]
MAAPTAESEELLAELQQQITASEQQDSQSPLLISLYNHLGEAYAKQYDYPAALECYEQAYTWLKPSDPSLEKQMLS